MTGQSPLELNPYAYTADNPLRWTDPTGQGVADVIEWCASNSEACAGAGSLGAALGAESGYSGSPAIPPVPPDQLTCDMGGLSDCLGDTTFELVPALPACIGGDCEPLIVTGGHAGLCFATFCNLEPPRPTPGCNK